MAGVELATAYVALTVETKNIREDVEKGFRPTEQVAAKHGDKAGKKFAGGMKHHFGTLAGMFGGVMAGLAVKDFIGDSLAAAKESNRVGNLTAAVITATGGAAKVTADQVKSYSEELARKTGIDRKEIQSGANMLLTFKNVHNELGKGNDIFSRATAAALDLSKAGFGSVGSASKALGKALNDPIKGITALGRMGVQFTDDQKKQIKTLVQHGDLLGAQKIIMDQVSQKVGGVAAAVATTGQKAAVEMDSLKETLGNKLLPIGKAVSQMFIDLVDGVRNSTGAGGQLRSAFETIQPALSWIGDHLPLVGKAIFGVIVGMTAWKVVTLAHTGVVKAANAASAIQLFWLKLHTVGTKENAIVQGIASAASKTWAAAQWLLNAAMEANPIGIIIVAIVALVGLFVLAYKKNETFRKFVQAAWAKIKEVVGAVADWFVNTLWPALQSVWDGLVSGVQAVWGWMKTAWDGILAAISFVWSLIQPILQAVIDFFIKWILPAIKLYLAVWKMVFQIAGVIVAAAWFAIKWAFDQIMNGIGWVADKFVWFRDNVIGPVWDWIKGKISDAWNWINQNVFAPIGTALGWLKGKWDQFKIGIGIIWDWIKGKMSATWNWINANVFGPIKTGIQWVKDAFEREKRGIGVIWDWLKTKVSDGWNWIRDKVFTPFKTGLGLLKDKFETVKTGIGKVWDGLKEIAKAPIKFIIQTVLNDGLIAGFNWLSGKVGGPHVDKIPLPKGFASGGVMPGYTPGRDVHTFISPTAGRLDLSGGEAVMRPEFTRLAGGKRGIDTLNAMARAGRLPFQHFASGGIWGNITGAIGAAGSWIADKASAIWKFLHDPMSYLKSKIPAIAGVGNIVDYGKAAVGKMLTAAVDKIKAVVGIFDDKAASQGGAGMGYKAMEAWVRANLPGVAITSSYRSPEANARAGGSPTSLHLQGRALDLAPSMGTFNKILSSFGDRITQLFYSPADGRTILNGRPFHMGAALKADHWDHVHWGMARGGVIPTFDSGGTLRPGINVVNNGTGADEHLRPVGGGPVTVVIPMEDLAQLKTLEDFFDRISNSRNVIRKTARSGRVTA